MEINICVSVNSKYTRYLYVMLTSLFINNSQERIHIYVLQRDLTQADKNMLFELVDKYGQKVSFIEVDETRFDTVPTSLKFSLETYFRLLMAELLPREITRVLYLDVDIIVCGSIRELYLTDFEDHLFAACHDIVINGLNAYRRKHFKRYDDLRYFNAGVMLWNIDAVREQYSFRDYMDAAKELNYELPLVDQDLLNYMMYDKVKYLDAHQYNYLVERDQYEKRKELPTILHYAGCNPWQVGVKSEVYKIWWEYAGMTPFYTNFVEEQLERNEQALAEQLFERQKHIEIKEIYRRLYELKGTGRIAQAMDRSGCKFALYGGGILSELFWTFMEEEAVKNMPVVIMDRGGKQLFHGIPVKTEFDWVSSMNDCVVIVTPSYRTDLLVEQIQTELNARARVISLRKFLEDID